MDVNNSAVYDAKWADWELMKEIGPMSRHVRRLAHKFMDTIEFKSILDVGCGTGIFLQKTLERYNDIEIAGLDLSLTGIELAQKKLPNANLYVHDIAESKPEGEYDLVTMIDVAEHIENDLAAFKNVREVCKRFFIVITLEGKMREFESEIGHVRNYAPNELKNKMEMAGFELVLFENWGWPMFSPIYRNLTSSCHKQELEKYNSLAVQLVYLLLMLNWPGKGDIIIGVGRPR